MSVSKQAIVEGVDTVAGMRPVCLRLQHGPDIAGSVETVDEAVVLSEAAPFDELKFQTLVEAMRADVGR